MSLFNRIGLWICRMYGDEVPNYSPVEKWSTRVSKITTPDRIIVAAILESFAKNFEHWKKEGIYQANERVCANTQPMSGDLLFNNTKTKVKVKIIHGWSKGKSRDNDRRAPWFWHPEGMASVVVNNVPIDRSSGTVILSAWQKLETAKRKANEVASRAKADMERNEAAWNLAETLLGMKRNEHGALVPVVSVEEA